MKKVALIDLNGTWQGIATLGGVYPSLGIECLAAVAKNKGWRPEIIHQQQQGLTDHEVIDLAAGCNVAGFTVLEYNFTPVMGATTALKRQNPDTITIVGGNLPSAAPELFNCPAIDLVVIGEGEQTFAEILTRVENGETLAGIPGTCYRTEGSLRVAPRRGYIENLDEIPFPLRDPVALAKTRMCGVWTTPIPEQRIAGVSYSRGCTNNCSYCSSRAVWGRRATWRSPENMVKEIKQLEDLGVNGLQFNDLTFNLSPQHVFELCRSFTNAGLQDLHWFCFCNLWMPNQPPEIWDAMYQAGCRKIGIGIEDPLLCFGNTKQPEYLDNLVGNIRRASAAGLLIRGYFMIGHPDQGAENFQAIIEFMQANPIDEIRLSIYTPLHGTPDWDKTKLLTHDWSKFDTNHLVVKGPYSPEAIEVVRGRIARSFYNSEVYKKRKELKISQGFDRSTYEFLEAHLHSHDYMS